MEADLGLNLLSVGVDGPSLDVGRSKWTVSSLYQTYYFHLSSIYCVSITKEQVDGFVVVSDVLFPPLLNLLCVNILFGGGDSTGVNGLLEVIFLLQGLLILLEFEKVAPFRIIED